MPRGIPQPKWPIGPDHPDWPTCACGCGTPVPFRKTGNQTKGLLPGQPRRFAHGHKFEGVWKDGKRHCNACLKYKLPAEMVRRDGRVMSRCLGCARAKNREWHERHGTAYRLENLEHERAEGRKRAQIRRARERGVFIEAVDPRVVYERDEGICGICGDPVGRDVYHVDHVVPIARGGEHSYANVQVAHAACNARKWAHIDYEHEGSGGALTIEESE